MSELAKHWLMKFVACRYCVHYSLVSIIEMCCDVYFSDIVVSGQKYYFKARNDQDRENWIERLQDASRITVNTALSR